jgi:hypothetical protein
MHFFMKRRILEGSFERAHARCYEDLDLIEEAIFERTHVRCYEELDLFGERDIGAGSRPLLRGLFEWGILSELTFAATVF